ncbi:MAG: N-6 DNA methylase [Deltaproteobacteria bacterium]|nr:N-6 DNA methylase [Deltaproteobacteria bacterium]MCL5891946.1 N-6 DNA methylase [Deltaproteobacteria bacterium]
MLNQDTKRKIDTARQILVGKVPDPKAQVEQITTALIYKFMDDMDKEVQEYGGKSTFFTNGYEKYAWTKLMDQKFSGQDRLNLYVEAIATLSQNPYLPQLFRDIFKDAFLPYRDPATLNLFLKEINGFTYDHSEDLGDAFEYLLSILGSQGDAGQFRTPRHIIDFIVSIIDPQKEEIILDPACGTAGFLISAYKHILKQNCNKPLTPDEKKNLMENLVGYDISPDMVRLSRVNMYLHGFSEPKIYEYDTLTSEDKWEETFNVIMTNPPFMTPKGGIRPHKRFSVQANRSEVLFVDYVLEHLRQSGRAGIIVPEGIIFQSATAYKALRKLLLEDGLLAVISLPAGVFNPYSGVKTSILIFDDGLSKKTKEILFLKIKNDGFDLGAQRRKIDKNDIPQALDILRKWKLGEKVDSRIAVYVQRNQIANTDDYSLSAHRYRVAIDYSNAKWPMVELEEVLEYEQPTDYIVESVDYNDDYSIPVLTAGKSFILGYTNEQKGIFHKRLPVIIFDDFTTATKFVDFPFKVKSSAMKILHAKKEKANIRYLFYMMQKIEFTPGEHKRYWISQYSKFKIPLPPLEIQKEIVEQIEVKQKAIDAAKAVIENLERERRYFGRSVRKLEDVKWVELGEVADFVRGPFGGSLKKEIFKSSGYLVYEQHHAINNDFNFGRYFIDNKKFDEMKRFKVLADDLLVSCSGTMGKIVIVPKNARQGIINQALLKLTPHKEKLVSEYLKLVLEADFIQSKYFKDQSGSSIQNVASIKVLQKITIPLPSLETQKQLVAEMEEQEKIIEVNKKLITMMEQKIADVLNEI